jgi:Outer membrane protein beta-barrel domain
MNRAAYLRGTRRVRAREDIMNVLVKRSVVAAAVTLFTAAPLLAQTERGYVSGVGGFAASPDATSGNVLGEAGVRIAPHLLVFGSLGQFHNLQPSDAQPAVDSTTASLAAAQGLSVVGTARVPAWYGLGGLRYEVPMQGRVSPYVLGGLGAARLTPAGSFAYTSGTLPDGSTPDTGTDVTDQLVTAGDFIAPPASTAFMFTLGGGVEVPVARHWAVDVGYRFSRVEATTPLNAQGATFGFGYRF